MFLRRGCGPTRDSRTFMSSGCWHSLAGLIARHNALNDIIHRALGSAGVPSVMEPRARGLTSSDERHRYPDGMTMIPWSEGRCLAWDATVSDSLGDSHLNRTRRSSCPVRSGRKDPKICRSAESICFCAGRCRDS